MYVALGGSWKSILQILKSLTLGMPAAVRALVQWLCKVVKGSCCPNLADKSMTADGTVPMLPEGQSMAALPRYIRHQPVRQWRERHRPQCRNSALCSRSSDAQQRL